MNRHGDWSRVATLYAERELSIAEIARLTGVPASTIRSRASREGWPTRQVRNLKDRRAHTTYRVMLIRIFRALDRQMREIERRLEAAERSGRRAADLERDARALASITRTLEKLGTLQREAEQSAAARTQGDETGRAAETHRSELERRLAGLLAGAGEAGLPEKSE